MTSCFQAMLDRENNIATQLWLVENDTTNIQIDLEQDISNDAIVRCEMRIQYIIDDVESVTVIPCEVVDETNGIIWTQFSSGDLIAGGPYRFEFELEYYDGTIETLNRDIDGNLLNVQIDKELL